jgi:hypothetical protein
MCLQVFIFKSLNSSNQGWWCTTINNPSTGKLGPEASLSQRASSKSAWVHSDTLSQKKKKKIQVNLLDFKSVLIILYWK